jgi:hypothetical protein
VLAQADELIKGKTSVNVPGICHPGALFKHCFLAGSQINSAVGDTNVGRFPFKLGVVD